MDVAQSAGRMAAVHPLCNHAKYGKQDEKILDGISDVEMSRVQKQKLEKSPLTVLTPQQGQVAFS